MSIGKSKAKIYVEKDTKTTLRRRRRRRRGQGRAAGDRRLPEGPRRATACSARALPKGVLLVGPPGTGKTLLARAVAGEAGVPFFSISGSEFVEMFVGVGAARVRDLFEQARKKAPCIIFIDELDALGRARGVGPMAGGHDEKEQTLNQLLVELDGFDPSQGIILLAATNRPEILDPALLRAGPLRPPGPGRPARQAGPHPDPRGARHARSSWRPTSSLEQVAALTPGFTGADLANLVNEAALLATRRGAEAVTHGRLQRGDRAHRRRAGEEATACSTRRSARSSPTTRWATRWSRWRCRASTRCTRSRSSRAASARSATRIQRPTEDRFLMTREELENKMAVLLGGRAAEQLVFGELSTGAADDLVKVTDIARSMVTRYGMDRDARPGRLRDRARQLPRRMPSRGRRAALQRGRPRARSTSRCASASTGPIRRRSRSCARGAASWRAWRKKLLEKETLTADELPRPTPPPEAEAA